jgi:hypothetical protein
VDVDIPEPMPPGVPSTRLTAVEIGRISAAEIDSTEDGVTGVRLSDGRVVPRRVIAVATQAIADASGPGPRVARHGVRTDEVGDVVRSPSTYAERRRNGITPVRSLARRPLVPPATTGGAFVSPAGDEHGDAPGQPCDQRAGSPGAASARDRRRPAECGDRRRPAGQAAGGVPDQVGSRRWTRRQAAQEGMEAAELTGPYRTGSQGDKPKSRPAGMRMIARR